MRGKLLVGAAALLGCVAAANAVMVTWPALQEKHLDPRNESVTAYSYLHWGIDPTSVVVDLWGISAEASMADVDRVLLDTAKALRNRTFSTIRLAYRGQERFQMEGAYFRQLGEERDWQNPAYTIRTLPENLQDKEGRPAFDTWTGGLLGVLNRQMEDHNTFHRQWYIDDL